MRAVLCIALLAFAGCSRKDKIPSGVIPKKEMEAVLWDMIKADRFVASYIRSKKDSLMDKKKESATVYEKVFLIHDITKKEFIRSYKFYLGRPDITKVMFDSISARSERSRASILRDTYDGKPGLDRDSLIRSRDSLNRSKTR